MPNDYFVLMSLGNALKAQVIMIKQTFVLKKLEKRSFRVEHAVWRFIPNILLIFVFTTLVSCGQSKKEKPETPVFVEAITIKPVLWQSKIDVVGTLRAEQGIVLKTETPGRVAQIFFKPGQMVKKGDPLVQLNPDILNAQKHASQANLSLQKMNFDRFQALHKKSAVSQMEYDKAFAEYRSAQSALEKANAELEQLTIKAPFEGQVGLNLVDLGDYVTTGASLVSLQDTQPMYVDFQVPEIYLSKLKLGNKVEVHVDAYKDRMFSGKLSALNNSVDSQTRMLAVRAEIPNPQRLLFPGMFAQMTLFLGEAKSVVMIPKIALVASEKGRMVYKIVNQTAKTTFVTTQEGDENQVIIKKGLKSGDQIITAGQMKLREGSPVVVANP